MTVPRVSIIMPTCNRPRQLGRAVASLSSRNETLIMLVEIPKTSWNKLIPNLASGRDDIETCLDYHVSRNWT